MSLSKSFVCRVLSPKIYSFTHTTASIFFFAGDIINQSDKICSAPHRYVRMAKLREHEDDPVEHGQVQRELQAIPGNVFIP